MQIGIELAKRAVLKIVGYRVSKLITFSLQLAIKEIYLEVVYCFQGMYLHIRHQLKVSCRQRFMPMPNVVITLAL